MDFISQWAVSFKELSLRSQASLCLGIFVMLFHTITSIRTRHKQLNLPVVEANNGDFKEALMEGVKKVHFSPASLDFRMLTSLQYPETPFVLKNKIILPACTLDEVRNLPENKASFSKVVHVQMYTKYTGLVSATPEIITATRVDLTRHIMSNLDGLQDEVKYGFDKELGLCEDWTPFCAYLKLARIVALLSGRLFVGLPLSRQEEWINASVNYTRDVMVAREAIVTKPQFIRPFVAPFLPEVKSVRTYRERGTQLLEPLTKIVSVRDASKDGRQEGLENEGNTMMAWILKYSHDKSMRTMAENQMSLTFTAIHTTTTTVCQAVFDLVARPEYIQPLRDEIEQVMKEDGRDIASDGSFKFKKQSLPKLRKLDSFLKESQRLSPIGLISLTRITTAPLTLSTGHTIPKGVQVAFPAYTISLDPNSTDVSSSHNPKSYSPPHEFDGFRFVKLRATEGKKNTVFHLLPFSTHTLLIVASSINS